MNGFSIWLASLIARFESGERFRRATKSDYRTHFFLFATAPVFSLFGILLFHFVPESTNSGFPFWLIITLIGGFYVFLSWAIASKTPLQFSLPMAAISWAIFAWFIWQH